MGELEDATNRKGFTDAMRLQYEQHGLYTFNQFPLGTLVTIDLLGEGIAGIQVEPDQVILGTLTDNKQAFIKVEESPHMPDIFGREIGLAVMTDILTPGGLVPSLNVRCSVAAGQTFSYYIPEEVPEDSQYGMPSEYHNVAARYGRVIVGELTLFDFMSPRTT